MGVYIKKHNLCPDEAYRTLSRRDLRTQPGVLTPGGDLRNASPRRGDRIVASGVQTLAKRTVDHKYLPPFQGGSLCVRVPGLKPRAESCSPFGTKSDSFLRKKTRRL